MGKPLHALARYKSSHDRQQSTSSYRTSERGTVGNFSDGKLELTEALREVSSTRPDLRRTAFESPYGHGDWDLYLPERTSVFCVSSIVTL